PEIERNKKAMAQIHYMQEFKSRKFGGQASKHSKVIPLTDAISRPGFQKLLNDFYEKKWNMNGSG
ncbi:MAG: hypothetical protein VX667_07890, partial [Nitrospinota bacterium]|nr:hypothetical protein [Nitrospinota bacterium]